jgi:carbamoyltransferase
MNILGIWDGHDAGAALLVDGGIAAAVNEERLTRRKLEVGFPVRSIAACLAASSLRPSDVHAIAASTSDVAKTLGRAAPWTKERYYQVRRRKAAPGMLAALTRDAKYRLTTWPSSAPTRALSRWLLRRALLPLGLGDAPLAVFDHHECHAIAAAHASGFDRCAVLTIDGLGDGLSATTSAFRGGALERVAASPASHSLGVFFEHVTTLLNMRELEDEGKVMALADYSSSIDDVDNPLLDLVRVVDGRIVVSAAGGGLRRRLAAIHWRVPNEQFARMAQRVVERTCVALARDAVARTGERRLAVAGGVASNIKATRLARISEGVERLYVFPHMGDGGLALGAAIALARQRGDEPRVRLDSLALGPAFSEAQIEQAIAARGLTALRAPDIAAAVAALLAEGTIVMWFQGRMEYGPRALGQRSVLARPDAPDLRDRLNLILKRRVWYQPFCPSMLASEAGELLTDWDGLPALNPHMTMAYLVKKECRAALAAVIGIDGTCRPQIVDDESGEPFAGLLRAMRGRTGRAVVLNTSYNIHGEPLVCTPEDAVDVFLRSGADALGIGPFLVTRHAAG